MDAHSSAFDCRSGGQRLIPGLCTPPDAAAGDEAAGDTAIPVIMIIRMHEE